MSWGSGVGWILESELEIHIRHLLGDAGPSSGNRSLEFREDMKAATVSLREISFLKPWEGVRSPSCESVGLAR